MNTPIKQAAQAVKASRTSYLTRIGRSLRSGLFHAVHITAWVAYFAWLLVPPIVWFSASPAHSHAATYWVGGIYLIAAGLMTWTGYIANRGFQRWNATGEAWAGWAAVAFALPVLFAPTLPFILLAAVPSMGNRGEGESARERRSRDYTFDPAYTGLTGNVFTRD